MNWKILFILSVFVNLMLFFAFISYNIDLDENKLQIENLTQENLELKNQIELLEKEISDFGKYFKDKSEVASSELRNPSYDELKMFLEIDDTNELVYSDTFDCSGFALELSKCAKTNGLNCGTVETEQDKQGHMLNVFNTTDKGTVYIDATGNEQGTGKDKIAYIEIGKPYGTIVLSAAKTNLISCDIECTDLIDGVEYVDYSNILSYNYFVEFKKCQDFYEKCLKEYNENVQRFNSGDREYSYSDLNDWYDNLGLLDEQLSDDNFYYLSESEIVDKIQIYW